MNERRAIQLDWDEVCHIVSAEIGKILGSQIRCQVNIADDTLWAIILDGCRLPLPELCQLLQAVQATPGEWKLALPCDGERDVNDIGMELAEKLIARHLRLAWEYHLITANSLWLVGVTEFRTVIHPQENEQNGVKKCNS